MIWRETAEKMASHLEWEWQDGMLYRYEEPEYPGEFTTERWDKEAYAKEGYHKFPGPTTAFPVLDDPQTVGIILYMVMETFSEDSLNWTLIQWRDELLYDYSGGPPGMSLGRLWLDRKGES